MTENKKEIMILRHARARGSSPAGDFARPLTEDGQTQAQNIGKQLYDMKLFPQSVYSSTATRAHQTASLVCAQLSIAAEHIVLRDALYLADIKVYLSLLQQIHPRLSRVMIIGHNPALEDLLHYLLDNNHTQPNETRLQPATLVMLNFVGEWSDLSAHSCQISKRISG